MQVVRTPDDRFASLPDFAFAPHYVDIVDPADATPLRVHHLDEGPADAPIVLLMHGEPSWSFLYRHMIPPLVAAGYRCIAPDLIGFGRSDKPAHRDDYTYARHVEWMRQTLFDQLELRGITLVCQDWGGLVGLRLAAEHSDRFARLVLANTGLPTGDHGANEAFKAWQKFSQETETFPVGMIINGGCTSDLTADVIAAYDAPFPDESYKEGARQFPLLVPSTPDDPAAADQRTAWESLARFDRPVLCAYSDRDPITKGGSKPFLDLVPGAAGQPHTTIEGGGHFLQEDCGPALAQVVIDFMAATPAIDA